MLWPQYGSTVARGILTASSPTHTNLPTSHISIKHHHYCKSHGHTLINQIGQEEQEELMSGTLDSEAVEHACGLHADLFPRGIRVLIHLGVVRLIRLCVLHDS
jgi:hypothetical protein